MNQTRTAAWLWAARALAAGIGACWIGASACTSIADLDGYTFDKQDISSGGKAGHGHGGSGGHGGKSGSAGQGGKGGSGGTSGQGGKGGSGGKGGNNNGGSTGNGGTANGGSSAGGSGGGSCVPADKQQSSECSDCMNAGSACAAEAKACQDDPNCVGFNTCIGNCAAGDAACIETCATQFSTGTAKFWKYYGCNDASCHDNCYCTACSLLNNTMPCGQCAESKCMSECSTCAMDGNCIGLWMCITYCPTGDTVCPSNCQSAPELSAGLSPLVAFIGTSNSCVTGPCATECQ